MVNLNNKTPGCRPGIIAAAVVLLSPRPSSAALTITERQLYYEVPGTSLRNVNDEMFSGTPIVLKGKKYLAKPRSSGYSKAAPEMQEKWNSFYARLTEHEEGHGRRAMEAARTIENEIGNLKRRSCQELREAVNETGITLLKQLAASNADYDDSTRHGVLDGAVLEF